jgi:asparagine synthase (glutamine-hydrolysing)
MSFRPPRERTDVCGIAGMMKVGGASAADLSATLRRMVDALKHRGPDGEGIAVCASGGAPLSTALGHTRLAILDLTSRGAQPMSSAARPIWVTFNGEIYNFKALRAELESHGCVFRSDSDTEVILHGYEQWRERVVDRLQGMFAFAIWDGETRQLLLARDRLGIKPLYVWQQDDCLLFASEIRALLATGLVPRRLDPSAIADYLACQTVPGPRTLVQNVAMLGPGELAIVDAATGRHTRRVYWDLLDAADPDARRHDAVEARAHVRRLLDAAARLHLVSDVPVGVFLSGGIDSSALVALARHAGTTPRTFTVALPGTPHDEAAFAAVVARRFSSAHTEITIDDAAFRRELPGAAAAVDHPSGDGLNTYVVAHAVRQSGVKVALSGLGGDEIFGGYPSFGRLARLARYAPAWRLSPSPVRRAAAAAVRTLGRHSVGSAKAAAVLEGPASVAHAFPVMRELFSDADRRRLLPDLPIATVRPYVAMLEAAVSRHPEVDVMTLVSYAEARTYMHDVLLRDTDQMSMAHGLEVRVPLLDHRLVEYVMGLPLDAKRPGLTPKRLLVDSLGGELPDECVHRRKQGFVLPFDQWMKTDLRGYCEHHLGPAGLASRGVFAPAALATLWERFLAGDRRTSWSRPWTLVALNAWIEQNGLSL